MGQLPVRREVGGSISWFTKADVIAKADSPPLRHFFKSSYVVRKCYDAKMGKALA